MAFSSSSSENNFGESSSSKAFRGSSFREVRDSIETPQPAGDGLHFDILMWYPKYQSCQRYFLDHAQHEPMVQAFAAFINIQLPFQREQIPVHSSTGSIPPRMRQGRDDMQSPTRTSGPPPAVSLVPYLRRLVCTGMDLPPILHGFFGNDWSAGVGPQREQERRNYLFAAKSGGWASVKRDYDMLPLETVPFLRPLQDPTDGEIEAAEVAWGKWLEMEDWMLGNRTPNLG